MTETVHFMSPFQSGADRPYPFSANADMGLPHLEDPCAPFRKPFLLVQKSSIALRLSKWTMGWLYAKIDVLL
jgi:hypothetical protein